MTSRTTDTKLDPVLLHRWSPRAFDASTVPHEDLAAIIDAARWAPSAMNYQPWRFLYAERGDENWDRFLSLLLPGNSVWAQNASVLFFVLSERVMGERPSYTHSFDAGAAWALLAVQAAKLGYHTHGMAGVDFARAAQELGVPETFKIDAAIALGRIADPSILSETLQAREVPSGRKPREEIAYPGNFRS
jgi:nitroreductase